MIINGYLTGLAEVTDAPNAPVVTKDRAVAVWTKLYHETLLRKVEN